MMESYMPASNQPKPKKNCLFEASSNTNDFW